MKRKRDKWNSGWSRHFFVLTNSCLYYFLNESPENKDRPLGMIQLVGVEISMFPGDATKIIIDGHEGHIQYIKFTPMPKMMEETARIFLKFDDAASAKNWFLRLRQGTIVSNFSEQQKN